RRLRRDQSGDFKPGGGALLQQARDRGAMDKGGQAGGRDDATFLSPLSRQRGAAVVEPDRLQPGQPLAPAGAADAGRHLVADQLATAVGENRRTTHQHARYYWLLLAESHLTRRLFAGMLAKIALL